MARHSERLPGQGDTLFADGGVVDNTGTRYFTSLDRPPHIVVAVDAGVGIVPPPRAPYVGLNRLMNGAFKVSGLQLAASIVCAAASVALAQSWVFTASLIILIVVTAGASLSFPLAFIAGVITDLRWFGRGWPITLRAATDERLTNAGYMLAARSGRLSVVRLSNGNRAKTQLWPLPQPIAAQILVDGYRQTAATLGHPTRRETLDFLADPLGGVHIERAGSPTESRHLSADDHPR